jgi:hypothetical protein
MNNLGIHFNRGGGRGDDDTETPDSSDTDASDDDTDDETRHTDDDTVVHPIYTDPISVIYLHERLSGIFAEKVHGRYYLGVAAYTGDADSPVLDLAVSASTFRRFPFSQVSLYASAHCTIGATIPQYVPRIDILQVIIVRGVYSVVVKTTWLRAVQISWRRRRRARRN